MDRPPLDRWTDTTAFRCLLVLSALAVLPVLGAGVLTTLAGGAVLVIRVSAVDLRQAAFAVVSIGGVLGFIGYARAHSGARIPDRHNVAATLLCLAAGVAAAVTVAGYAVLEALDGLGSPWRSPLSLSLPALFAAANVVWAIAGIAWMQRLSHRYAEKTGRVFDSLPVVLMFVAIALATAAALTTTTL